MQSFCSDEFHFCFHFQNYFAEVHVYKTHSLHPLLHVLSLSPPPHPNISFQNTCEFNKNMFDQIAATNICK